MRNQAKFISLVSIAALTIGFLGGPVLAADTSASDAVAVLQAASKIYGSPAANLLENVTASSTSGEKLLDGLPYDPTLTSSSEPVIAEGIGHKRISIGLPFSSDQIKAERVLGDAISFDNRNGTTSVVIPKTDGSIQMAEIIAGSSAPSTFTYRLQLPLGGRAILSDSGLVMLLDSRGGYLGAIAPAWAVDALGKSVPTRYELNGNNLSQVVGHRSKSTNYPVIADPWLGIDMIDRTSWVSTGQYSPTLSIVPSNWGRAVAISTTYPFSSGLIAIVDQLSLDAAWSETLSKTSRTGYPNPDTPTMYVQFECHYFWVSKRSPRKASWNLDSKRPYGSMAAQAQKNCNVE